MPSKDYSLTKTIAQVSHEFINAPIGRPIVYYRGYLMRDAEPILGKKILQNYDVIRLRDHVMEMYEDGRVHLTQRRLGDFDYEYIMTKRERKR